jgi:hypothetical protein
MSVKNLRHCFWETSGTKKMPSNEMTQSMFKTKTFLCHDERFPEQGRGKKGVWGLMVLTDYSNRTSGYVGGADTVRYCSQRKNRRGMSYVALRGGHQHLQCTRLTEQQWSTLDTTRTAAHKCPIRAKVVDSRKTLLYASREALIVTSGSAAAMLLNL